MTKDRRRERLGELIQRQVAEIIAREFSFGDTLVTVRSVRLSDNHAHAAIFITVYPPAELDDVVGRLNKRIRKIQQALNGRLAMRPVPKIVFKSDVSEERSRRIEDLLKEIE